MDICFNGIFFKVLRIPPGGWLCEIVPTEDSAQLVYQHHVINATCWLGAGATDVDSFDWTWTPSPCPTPPTSSVASPQETLLQGGIQGGGIDSALSSGSTSALRNIGNLGSQSMPPQIGQNSFDLGMAPGSDTGFIFLPPGILGEVDPGFVNAIPNITSYPPIIDIPEGLGNLFFPPAIGGKPPLGGQQGAGQIPTGSPGFLTPVMAYREILRRMSVAPGVLLVTLDSGNDPNDPTVDPNAAEIAALDNLLNVNNPFPTIPPTEILLQSPVPGFTVDAKYGPQGKLLSPVPVAGVSTMVLDVQFETWLPLCMGNGGPLILSNRWSINAGLDEQRFSTHVYEGTATFNAAILASTNVTADQFRGWLVPKPATGYKRLTPEFVLLPDGVSVAYRVVDVQAKMYEPGIIPVDGAQIDIQHQMIYDSPDVDLPALAVTGAGWIDKNAPPWLSRSIWALGKGVSDLFK